MSFGDIMKPAPTAEQAAAQPEKVADPGTPPQMEYHRAELPPIQHDGGGGLKYWKMVPAEGDLTDGPAPTPSEGEHPLRYAGLHRRYHGPR